MSLMRDALLAASQSTWLREHATRWWFVRRTVSRFMPGEDVADAMNACRELERRGLRAVLTALGENVSDAHQAEQEAAHYVEVLNRVRALRLPAEVSVKLTHLGLDLGADLCFANLERIIQAAPCDSVVWVDMEASNYVDATLGVYRRARAKYPNVGICVQAYLYRTKKDLDGLLAVRANVRLVKGAYKEPAEIAFPKKKDVDENYFALAQRLLEAQARTLEPAGAPVKPAAGSVGDCAMRVAIATHDVLLIDRIQKFATTLGMPHEKLEFQMLYGIQRAAQEQLAREGYRCAVLISYGSYWYPWFMRRLAERPANVWFVVKNVFA